MMKAAATMRPSAPISHAIIPKIQIAAVSRRAMASDEGRPGMAVASERHGSAGAIRPESDAIAAADAATLGTDGNLSAVAELRIHATRSAR